MTTLVNRARLPEQVRATLSNYLDLDPTNIIVTDNTHKYAGRTSDAAEAAVLGEIFELMWQLNRQGLASDTLGNTPHLDKPLRTVLDTVLAKTLEAAGSDPFQYVELGPEPAKTAYIIDHLLKRGANLRGYTGIDINPYSHGPVTAQVSKVLPGRPVAHREQLFETVTAADCHSSGVRNLVTMLGFEEGNEHPAGVAAMLDAMLAPGDLLLTEMQLLPRTSWLPIFEFYSNPLMRTFSQVVLRRHHGVAPSDYGIYLVPISLGPGEGDSMVAVTAESVHHGNAEPEAVIVTNYCLKPQHNAYIQHRERSSAMVVLTQEVTADGSIAFQLSEKR